MPAKPTHYADIADTTIWRVWFTPPEGMTPEELAEWLLDNWADCEEPGIHEKDIWDAGTVEVLHITPMPKE